jgi:hypothetical protein
MFVKTIAWAAAATALLAAGGCVETRGSLTGAAERLDHNAHAMARDTSDAPAADEYPASYARDVRQLADDTRDFRDTAAERGASDPDTRASFRRLSRSYLMVRDEVDHSESPEARSDLKPVTDAYLDVEREMGGYPARHASAADED